MKSIIILLILGLTFFECRHINSDDAKIILEETGLTNHTIESDSDFQDALEIFQKNNDIEITGKLDIATKSVMSGNRCGTQKTFNGKLRNPWSKVSLTYTIKKYPKDMDEDTVKQVIKNAFNAWEERYYIKFEFKENEQSDIDITFQDTTVGDGPGQIIVNSTFPPRGDIYFDDELWTSEPTNGINLFMAALHAIGHSLGLEHSSNKNSIMYPFIPEHKAEFAFHDIDTKEMEKLYDFSEGILTDIDAIFSTERNIIYAIKGENCWKFNNRKLESGYPKNMHLEWPGLNTKVHAAYARNKNIYFIHGQEVYVYGNNAVAFVFPINTTNNFDAAVMMDKSLYYFSGSIYWEFVQNANRYEAISGSPFQIKDNWPGVPDNIDAVYTENNSLYFFKHDTVYRCGTKEKPASVDTISNFFQMK